MINKYKLYGIVGAGAVTFTLFVGMIGFTAGKNLTKSLDQKTIDVRVQKAIKKEKKKLDAATLDNKKVESFLIQYFSKESQGANYARLAGFMTDTALDSEKTKDQSPERQVSKDYEVNFQYQGADIFIDETNLIALADVRYSVDSKDDPSNSIGTIATLGKSQTKLVKIQYRLIDGSFKVSDMEIRDNTLNSLLTSTK